MTYRPRYTHKDDNHGIVLDFMRYSCGGFAAYKDGRTVAYTANYHGCKFIAHDCANIGGVFSDWLLECVDIGNVKWIEVKTEAAYKAKDHSLKPGELWLMENSGMFVFAVTDEDVREIFEIMTKGKT